MASKPSRLRSRPDETTLENKNILIPLSKSIIVLRMLFIFPTAVLWFDTGIRSFELLAMILLAIESLVGLLRWEQIRSYIARHPLVLSVDILLSIAVLSTSGTSSPFFLYLGATAVLIGLIYDGANRLILGLLTLGAFLLVPLIVTAYESVPRVVDPANIASAVGGLTILVILMIVGSSLRQIQTRTDIAIKLATRNAREAALGEERSRVARELHDSTVKSLVGIKLLSSTIVKSPDSSESTAQLIEKAADTAIEESRGILSTLRTKTSPPLRESVQEMIDELEVIHELPIHLECDCDDVPPENRYNIRKIIEEAITNAAMHSGTSAVHVTMNVSEIPKGDTQLFTASVQDFGRGFRLRKARDGHIGMASMRERAAEIGGKVSISSTPGSGTTVTLTVPLKKAGEDNEPDT